MIPAWRNHATFGTFFDFTTETKFEKRGLDTPPPKRSWRPVWQCQCKFVNILKADFTRSLDNALFHLIQLLHRVTRNASRKRTLQQPSFSGCGTTHVGKTYWERIVEALSNLHRRERTWAKMSGFTMDSTFLSWWTSMVRLWTRMTMWQLRPVIIVEIAWNFQLFDVFPTWYGCPFFVQIMQCRNAWMAGAILDELRSMLMRATSVRWNPIWKTVGW